MMHFTRRLALCSALVGIVSVAMPWKIGQNENLLGAEVWEAWVLAGVLSVGALLSRLGDRFMPLSRKSAIILLVSSIIATVCAVVFLVAMIYDPLWSPGMGFFMQCLGPGLGLASVIRSFRSEQR